MNFANEAAVEDILARAGWRIVHPELLSFREQVAIFASSATVAGIEGSALHTAIFCKQMLARLIVLRRDDPNANYDTIATTTGIDQRNLHGEVANRVGDIGEGAILDPVRCAARIIEAAQD